MRLEVVDGGKGRKGYTGRKKTEKAGAQKAQQQGTKDEFAFACKQEDWREDREGSRCKAADQAER
jgi:hypothetical protein